MLKIWQEQITLLGVIDTGALLASPKAFPVRADGRFFEVGLSQAFLEYGLWLDYGTGKETPRKSSAEGELAHTSAEAQPGLRSRNPRGNSGDLGRAKTSRASRTQSQARLNSAEAQPRTVGHNRKRRRWFSRKYYASVMRIKEFYEDNIGKTFTGILSNALNKNFGR